MNTKRKRKFKKIKLLNKKMKKIQKKSCLMLLFKKEKL